ncbi:MAG: hypothetical protein M1268_04655 [Patescibacteria group bacterium]|nr:hypothetical protein [Patescibacteria group bacterium]
MAEFEFLQNPITKKWVISAPRRAKRPDIAKGSEPPCPFCVGREKDEKEVYRIPARNASASVAGGGGKEGDANWLVRVIPNKFPFAPIHEVIVHSPDHRKNFDELPLPHIELIIKTYRQRFNEHQKKGQVCIFHNRGERGGESLPHPHTQLAVVPFEVKMELSRLDPQASVGQAPKALGIYSNTSENQIVESEMLETPCFYLFCPKTSQWPDEVWIAPKSRGRLFGEITDEEITDFAYTLQRLIQIFDHRHGNEFPFNFYIYPGGDWYLRLIPRQKTIGGFELVTGIFVNTQNPKETLSFIKEHFEKPDIEKIKLQHQAEYFRHV